MSQATDGLTDPDVISWSTTLVGAGALVCCLPALFGSLGTFVPELLQPGNGWAMETPRQRLIVNIYTWSVMLAIVSPPATVVGLILGVVAIKRAGRKTVFGRAVGGILVAAVLLSLLFAGHMLWTVTHTKYPRASLADGTGLPNKRMQLTKPAQAMELRS
jgi:hypothetical protein